VSNSSSSIERYFGTHQKFKESLRQSILVWIGIRQQSVASFDQQTGSNISAIFTDWDLLTPTVLSKCARDTGLSEEVIVAEAIRDAIEVKERQKIAEVTSEILSEFHSQKVLEQVAT